MSFKVRIITDQILHLIFPTQEEMCRTMMRFAEYYESPQFAGKIFTREEFIEWYRGEEMEFTYNSDWSGFNVPGFCFTPFKTGQFKRLTKEEKAVLKVLPKGDSFYVIATTEDYSALRHELGHALYYIDHKYQLAARDILWKLKDKRIPMGAIESMGYHRSVLLDELHACLIDGVRYLDSIAGIRFSLGWRAYFQYGWAAFRLNRLLNATLVKHNANL